MTIPEDFGKRQTNNIAMIVAVMVSNVNKKIGCVNKFMIDKK